MLNLNIVINENKEEADQKEILKEKSDHKKVGRNENVLVVQEKNLSIVTEMFNYIFLKASNAFNLASS